MEKKKLIYSFRNPNTAEDTADFLVKLFAEVNRPRVDEAIRQAAQRAPEPSAYLPADKPEAAG